MLFDAAWAADPYPVYAKLRTEDPVQRSPLGCWVVSRHADCLAILRDRRFGVQTGGPEAPFIFRDPPDHTRLRGLVQQAFTPRSIQALAPRIEQICAELLDAAVERGEADLVTDFGYPLPVRIISEILGVPPADHDLFRGWSAALARGLDPEFLLPPQAAEERLAGIVSFVEYFTELIAERRVRPGDDLISRLLQAGAQGDVLTGADLVGTCLLLLVAGHETTASLISGGALALMGRPESAELTGDAINELLRFTSPVQFTMRTVLADLEVAGTRLRAGDLCMVLIGSANHDPAVFTNPDVLDLDRTENPHLGFGLGIHHCLGAPLAKLEAGIALNALRRRVSRIEPAGEHSYQENIALRGLASLPVLLRARQPEAYR